VAIAFQRTLRCLERERSEHRALRLLLAAAILGAWFGWLLYASVPIYAVSQSGRIEVQAKTHRAAAVVSGRVVELSAELGASVTSEQILMHLDDGVERRKLDESVAALESLDLRARALQAQLTAEARVRESQRRAGEQALTRADLALRAAGDRVAYQEKLERISDDLHHEELISHLEAYKSTHELHSSQLRRDEASADLSKQLAENNYVSDLQGARVASLERELAELAAARASALASVNTARAQLERRVVRAPVSGRIGSVAPVQIGDVVREGDLIATVIPNERLRVVAEFAAADAFGRVKPGQAARVRLEGFSIVEFGTLDARVQQVAGESQRGTVRVELSLSTSMTTTTHLPVEHGVPGAVEVRVESASPWRMLLRGVLPQPPSRRPSAGEPVMAGDGPSGSAG